MMIEKRTYNVPLRKGFRFASRQSKTKRAVSTLRTFIAKHMKSDDVRMGTPLNDFLWAQGIRNPPHHVKIVTEKNDEGVVFAELEGHKLPSELAAEKEAKEKAEKKAEKAKDKPKPAAKKAPAKKAEETPEKKKE